jgi:guanosine-3',5'-bis(diphosphate) 3'-pyrophosphohydrolase
MADDCPLGVVFRALRFAAEKHRRQRRKDSEASPYINHLIVVADTLTGCGVSDPVTIVAAILHDTIEDTDTTPAELEAEFGGEVRSVVEEVTDNKALPKAARKQRQIEHAPRLSPRAKLIKTADKIANVRDMTDAPPADWPLQRREEYLDWAAKVVRGCRGLHPELEALFDRVLAEARQAICRQ